MYITIHSEDDVRSILHTIGAFQTGHFELRSGLHSPHYVQCAALLKYPRLAGEVCSYIVDIVEKNAPQLLKVDGVISPAIGGIIVGHEIARILNVESIFCEKKDGKLSIERFEVKKSGRYLVAEDVVTRGGRVQETMDVLRNSGGEPIGILAIVDRSMGQISFEVPFFAAIKLDIQVYEPADCPLCKMGQKLIHPGSR